MAEFDVLSRMMSMIPRRSGSSGNDMTESQSEMALRDRQQTAFARDVVLKGLDLMNKAETQTEKLYHQNLIRVSVEQLSPKGQAAMAPYLRNTPLDPVQMKRQKFVEQYGPPPKMPSEDASLTIKGQALFARSDYDARMKHAMTGEMPEKINVIGLEDGNVAMRNAENIVSILNPYQAGAAEQARIAGVPVHQFIADNGVAFQDPVEITRGGQKYRVRKGTNLLNMKPVVDTVRLGPEATPGQRSKFGQLELELVAAFNKQDESNSVYSLFKEQVLEGGMSPEYFSENHMDKLFPGNVVSLIDVRKTPAPLSWIADDYTVGDDFVIKLIPGQRIDVKTPASITGTKSGYQVLVYGPDQKLYDMTGREIRPGDSQYPFPAELKRLGGGL